MSLSTLKKEYEERRQALIDQLQKNQHLDPATQHQIYGAIKEIENFLKTIDYQIAVQQEQSLNVELSRERPSPIVERTQKVVYHVANGTKRIFTHHIPSAAKKVVSAPKQYFARKKEEARLRKEIEVQLRARQQATEHVVLEHPHQELEVKHEEPLEVPSPPWDETVHRTEVISDHEKRPKVVTKPAKTKAHPSKHAPGKKGGQHKPHHKKNRYRR